MGLFRRGGEADHIAAQPAHADLGILLLEGEDMISQLATAQIIATHNPSTTSWVWAWANDSVLPAMSRASRTVRNWGKAHGHAALTEPRIPANAEQAATLAALALRITRATGFYRGTGGASVPIITFGAVTLTKRDGTTSTFTIGTNE
jgi:Family of unknown function (DUF6882)